MQLLSSDIAQDIMHEGFAFGADFVDVFIERTHNDGMVFKNSRAEDI